MAKKKTATKKSKTASPKKKAAAKTKRPSFAKFLDEHMIAGITWKKLHKLAVAEADQRGITSQRTVTALKTHARSRGRQDGWTVTMDDKKVKLQRAEP